ncbi:MAG: hypothetical protein Q9210_003513 [Variospora velana]
MNFNGGGMEVIGGVSGVLAIVGIVGKVTKKLNEIKESYDSVALNIQLAAIQLSTIRDALEAIAEWRLSNHTESKASRNFDGSLAESLKGCAVLIHVIDGKLGEAGYTPGVKRKIRHLWLEDVLKGYMSNLDGQVRALQLLLTIFQCRTATEQTQRLERAEARSLFEKNRADTASLTIGNKDLEDAASVLSFDPSVNFDMDEELLKHPRYIEAYGNVSRSILILVRTNNSKRYPPLPKRPAPVQSPSAASSPSQAEAQVFEPPLDTSADQAHDISMRQEPRLQRKPVKGGPIIVEGADRAEVPFKTLPPSLIHTVPIPPVALQGAQASDAHRTGDPSFASAVEAFKGELSTAFDNVPENVGQGSVRTLVMQDDGDKSETQVPDVRAHSPQSERGSSDFDEMITLLPLASHFNISRNTESTSKLPRRLSADSREPDNRRTATEDSMIMRSARLQPSSSDVSTADQPVHDVDATTEPSNIEDATTLHVEPGEKTLEPSTISRHPSGKSIAQQRSSNPPSQRSPDRRKSTDSALYRSSITENQPGTPQSPQRSSSIHSDLYASSIAETRDVKATTARELVKVDPSEDDVKPNSDINEQAAQDVPPHRSEVSEKGTPPSVNVKEPDMVLVDGHPAPSAASQTAPAILPPPEPPLEHLRPSDDSEVQSLRPRSATTGERTGPSVFKNAALANNLRRTELVSSDYVTYSNNEHHGLRIILTPESEAKAENSAAQIFTAPPSRPPPPAPQSTNSFSTLTPTNSLTSGRRSSNDSSQPRYTTTSAMTSSPVHRDDSINETLSTMSSSDRSERQSLSSPMTSASDTIATSFSHPPDSLRGQAQSELHKLQLELTAAKSRGDSSAQKASLQQSMDIIQRTYLSSSVAKGAETGAKFGSPPKSKGNRVSLMPKKSMSLLSMVNRKSKQTDLHEAARSGDSDTLRTLLEEKININARGDRFKTPQMEAALRSHLHCLEILKEFGADELAVDAQGKTVLHIAVVFNQPKAVTWLMQAYPPSAPDMPVRKSSRLAWATDAITGSRSSKILREASDGEGSRPLHLATKLGLAPMVTLLLDNGSDIEAKDNWGRTSLVHAAILDRVEIVKLLLSRGADHAAKDAINWTALHWAAVDNHLDLLKILLAKGDSEYNSPNWTKYWSNNDGDLAIHVAARKGHTEAVKMLRRHQQSSGPWDSNTKHGETLIHIATLTNHLDLAKSLLLDNADVNAWAKPHSYHLKLWPEADNQYTPKALPLPYNIIPLHYACTRGFYEMTELLLENGAWVNAVPDDDQHGKSPLMMAVESGNTNLVCLLLARGAKVNAAVEATLVTALHIACSKGDLDTTQELLRYGAKTSLRTKERHTAEELVAKVKDAQKRSALEAFFSELSKQRYAKIRAQMAENRRANATEASLPPQPSPVPAVPAPPYQGQRYITEFVDPENDAFPEAPPAYTPGPRAAQHLIHRQGVNRPTYG